jgi:hypothetical protein
VRQIANDLGEDEFRSRTLKLVDYLQGRKTDMYMFQECISIWDENPDTIDP